MKRLLLLFLFLLCSNTANAIVETKPTAWFNTGNTSTYVAGDPRFQTTREAACRNYYDRVYSLSGPFVSLRIRLPDGPDYAGQCLVSIRTSSGAIQENGIAFYIAYTCPVGFTYQQQAGPISAQRCVAQTCPAGMTLNTSTNKCEDNCLPEKDKTTERSVNCAGNVPSSVCMPNNCAANVITSGFAKIGACNYGTFTAKYTGSTCTNQTAATSLSNPANQNPAPEDDAKTKCIQQGQSFGVVNGVTVCVPKSSSGATPVTQGNQTTTTTTNTDTAGNTSTESSTELKSATESDGQVTSQLIKKNSDGTQTEETKTMSKADFCTSNPRHDICKGTAPEDDEQPSDVCEDNPDLPQCLSLGEPDAGENLATETRTVSFSPVTITSGGSCPPDKSLSIAGKSVTFSYSWICTYASMFKPFMLAFAYLSAAMFLFWGYKGAQT